MQKITESNATDCKEVQEAENVFERILIQLEKDCPHKISDLQKLVAAKDDLMEACESQAYEAGRRDAIVELLM